ncbi:MAG: cupin domain-containing protein [Thermoleophilia bacterium]
MAETPAFTINLGDVVEHPISGDGAEETYGLPLLPLTQGTGAFDIRAVRIAAGGISADHAHAWEQANLVLEGEGTVTIDGEARPVKARDFVYVPPNAQHVFANTGQGDLVLLAVRGPGF